MNSASLMELDWLKRWSQYAPRRIALKDHLSGREISYGELYKISEKIAFELRGRGIVSGDRVVVLSKNNWKYIPLFFALQRLGAIMVPLNFRLSPKEIEYILRDSGARLFFYQKEFETTAQALATSHESLDLWLYEDFEKFVELSHLTSLAGEIPFVAQEEDPCMILYTSGTTGLPKGALVTYRMLFWNSINTTLRLNLSENDVHLSFMPFFHTGGWNVLLTPFLHRGAKTVVMEKFEAEEVLKTLETEKATILFGVPTMLDMMARSPEFVQADLSAVRYAVVGGEAMPLPLIQTWQNKGIPVRQGYGLTEFGPNVFSLNEEDSLRKIGSIGFPNFYIQTRVVNSEGEECKAQEIGELWLQGPTCIPGYWNNAEASTLSFSKSWFKTGDLVRFDEEGYFYVVGRKKEMFISGGENIYPAEVEQALRAHDGIREVAVIGVPDERWGEVGKAFIVPKNSQALDFEELKEFCSLRLAKYKIPKHVVFMEALPKGDSGKILKRALAEL